MTFNDPQELEGRTVVTADGDKIGKVDTIFLDVETEKPEWAAVKTGMFGGKVSLVPLSAATETADGDLSVPFDKDRVKNAPHHEADQDLSPEDEAELFRYYGVSYGSNSATTAGTADRSQSATTYETTGAGQSGADQAFETGTAGQSGKATTGYDTSGPTTDDAMTLSEERLRVGTERVEAGRARLRKYVVTEQVSQTVPVSHEEVRVQREAITDANVGDAVDGPAISEEEHEVVLHAERPVVATETVPVERIRLDTETVTDSETVTGEVRKEQIDLDGADVDRTVRR